MKVSCLGPKQSYSALAALEACPEAETVYCASFSQALTKLIEGETDFALLPVENWLMGSVVQNLDLISASENIVCVKECILPIHHRLVTKGNVPYCQIGRICSHPQALSQCTNFIEKNFPNARLVYTHSTAESISMLDEHTAGIVGEHVRGDGLVLSDDNIADSAVNYTRFLLFRRGTTPPESSMYVYFTAVCKHEPGTLYRLLGIFEKFGLNLTQIESRPIRDKLGEYRFFIEIEGDMKDPCVKDALKEVQTACIHYRLLGAY